MAETIESGYELIVKLEGVFRTSTLESYNEHSSTRIRPRSTNCLGRERRLMEAKLQVLADRVQRAAFTQKYHSRCQ